MAREITRQMLESKKMTVQRINGVDVVCKRNGEPFKIQLRGSKHPLTQDKLYQYIGTCYQGENQAWAVHRIIYAWYNGVCPGDMTVNHIDDDPTNNNIENLELVTLQENLAKKKVNRNQHTYNWTEEELNKYKDIKNAIAEIKIKISDLEVQKEEALIEWRLNRNSSTRAAKDAINDLLKAARDEWRKLIAEKKQFELNMRGK